MVASEDGSKLFLLAKLKKPKLYVYDVAADTWGLTGDLVVEVER